MSEKLTPERVRELIKERPSGRPHVITFDKEIRGLGLRVTKAGHAAYVLVYRVRESGVQRTYTIGAEADFTLRQARARASELRKQVAEHKDPVQELRDGRAAATLNEVIDGYIADELPRRAPATAAEYRGAIKRWIKPELGSRKIDDLGRADVEVLHRKVSKAAPIRANRVVAVLAAIFRYHGKSPADNPARGIRRNPENRRTRFLSAEELGRLMTVLGEYRQTGPKAADAVDAIVLLLLTGSRRGEVIGARWSEFVGLDGPTPHWIKPPARTKDAQQHIVPLGAMSAELLRQRRASKVVHREFVFAGRGTPSHELALQRAWARIRETAMIPSVHLHDLRHTHASLLVASGYSLPQIGKLLGHARPSTTARYSHLDIEPLRSAVDRVGAIVSGAK
jgi:integrase